MKNILAPTWRNIKFHISDGLPRWFSGKESACNAGDPGLFPGSGRSPGERNGNPLRYSCMGNPIDRGTWRGYSPWGRERVRHNLVTKQHIALGVWSFLEGWGAFRPGARCWVKLQAQIPCASESLNKSSCRSLIAAHWRDAPKPTCAFRSYHKYYDDFSVGSSIT